MSLTQLLIQVAARGTLLLLLTALAGLLFRRASAATRHLIWTGGLVTSLIVPLISLPEPALPVLPAEPFVQPVAVAPAPAPVTSTEWSGTLIDAPPPSAQSVKSVDPSASSVDPSVISADPSADSSVDWSALGLAWVLGLTLVALRLVAGSIAISRLARKAVAVTSPAWLSTIRGLKSVHSTRVIRYLESSEVSTPCTWGTLSPTILLPMVGAEWSGEERRQVVVHELAHIRRYDCATQVITTLAVALNWFNPLAWLAQRQSRVAREQACDDAVLAAGGVASTYATLLLTAAAPEGGRWLPAEAQAMARRSQIGDRLLAVLDPARRRTPLTGRAIGWISATAFAAALPVVSIGFAPPSLRASGASEAIRLPVAEPISVPVASRATLAALATSAKSAESADTPSASSVDPSADCDMSRTSTSQSSYSDDDGDARKNFFVLTWKGGGCMVRMEGRGRVTLNEAEDDIATLSEGGRVVIETSERGVDRSYKVTNRNGSLERRYQVNDKDATLDAEAIKWRGTMILEFIRRTGYDAVARTERIKKRGGIDALVAEIRQINSDGVRSIYLKAGLEAGTIKAGEAARLLELVRGIESDGDAASVLKATPEPFLSDEAVQRAYASAAEGIESDGDLASVLMSAIRSGQLSSRSCEWVLGLVKNIESDGDRSAVLISATESLQWNSTCVRRSLELSRDIGSDGDKSATLIRFLDKHGLPEELAPVFFATTRTIGSDGDHSSVLIRAARSGLVRSEKLKALYLDSARDIGSDGDREAAIRALDRS